MLRSMATSSLHVTEVSFVFCSLGRIGRGGIIKESQTTADLPFAHRPPSFFFSLRHSGNLVSWALFLDTLGGETAFLASIVCFRSLLE